MNIMKERIVNGTILDYDMEKKVMTKERVSMKFDLMKKYTFKQFKREFYKQVPEGSQEYLFHCWNTYQANKAGVKR